MIAIVGATGNYRLGSPPAPSSTQGERIRVIGRNADKAA